MKVIAVTILIAFQYASNAFIHKSRYSDNGKDLLVIVIAIVLPNLACS